MCFFSVLLIYKSHYLSPSPFPFGEVQATSLKEIVDYFILYHAGRHSLEVNVCLVFFGVNLCSHLSKCLHCVCNF